MISQAIPAIITWAINWSKSSGQPLAVTTVTAIASAYGITTAIEYARQPLLNILFHGVQHIKNTVMTIQVGPLTTIQWANLVADLWATLIWILDHIVYTNTCLIAAQHAINIWVLSVILVWTLSLVLYVFEFAASVLTAGLAPS